jgi:hypothetical protein
MVTIKSSSIQETYEAMSAFGKANFGVRNGEDFSSIARAFLQTEAAKSLCQTAALMGMLGTLLIPKNPAATPEQQKAQMDKIMSESPVRDVIADVFYLGYKIGRRDVEVDRLEAIGKTEVL